MLSQKIRKKFLEYFQKKHHAIISSSPVVPHDDPTLLFINAGMNQFKDVFLGKSVRDYSCAVTTQKCIRVGGKHNDLENVGHTSRHLTFFEMLGNFSFGDYFKKEAIDFAWEVALKLFEFNAKDLWATVFHEDEESFQLWKTYLPEEKIIRMGEKDNFWSMGDTGPCGPCSELYFDKGSRFSHARNPGEDISGERFLEFWNLVFMEFNRDASGSLHPLPKKCVDTGAGLERVVSLKMGVDSLFETDILRAMIREIEQIAQKKYTLGNEDAAAFHVIADHTRSLAFAIADGVQPSNIERGYVLRKVLRRAVRYGRQIGLDQPFLGKVVPSLIEMMGEDFPELKASQDRIIEILTLEEESFLRTLKRGGNILNQVITDAKAGGEISGEDAFKLKDTYGLPLDEILLLAKDANLTVDINRFEELEHEARQRSRGARKKTEQLVEEPIFEKYLKNHGPSLFLGYGELITEAVILGIFKNGVETSVLYPGEEGVVLLDRTPFYAEKGGQVGDQGILSSKTSRFCVVDCVAPFTDLIAHQGVLEEGELHVGGRVTATVDQNRRQKIANNHTATHLLHWALRTILGAHVKQAGSVVEPSRLRFDFSHHKALSSDEIARIEALINEKIRGNGPVLTYELTYREAQGRSDIIQFFGEKYGSTVRVVDLNDSKELCGGTHTQAVGTLGYFRIVKEASIASGVRRIEAVTGEDAEAFVKEEKEALLNAIEKEKQENKLLGVEIARLRKKLLTNEVEKMMQQAIQIGSTTFLAQSSSMEPQELKEAADLFVKKFEEGSLLLFLIGKQKDKCTLLARVSADLIGKGVKAGDLIKEIAPIVGGKGGGKADAAQGGGTEIKNIPQALKSAKTWFEQKNI